MEPPPAIPQAAPASVVIPLPSARSCAYEVRLFEWVMSGSMLGIAFTVMFSPKSIMSGGFYLMGEVGLTAPVLAVIFLMAGGGRAIALWANGHGRRWGPMFRFTGAVIGLIIWVQMLYALTMWSLKSGHISIGVSVYLFLGIGEAFSCYRAALDGRYHAP